MQEKVVVYGLGRYYEKYKQYLSSRYHIIGYSDGDRDKAYKCENFYSPENIKDLDYDLVLITSRDAAMSIIIDCIEKYKISAEKISVFDGMFFSGFSMSGNGVKKLLDLGAPRKSIEYFFERFLVAYDRLNGVIPECVKGGMSLDIGCGPGNGVAASLAYGGGFAVGVDIDLDSHKDAFDTKLLDSMFEILNIP